ncbi:RNA-binding protein RO60 [Periplaneta americana]|uniref:RNA-binding protein RO60 n=1 Tax=Periplaneta americana TaxID=6978 RepID=UPI0037E89EA0
MTSTSSEVKLKRFLHYGRETPLYQPGDRYVHKYFERDNVTSIEALVADGKETDAVVHIVKAFSDGYSAHPQSLVFTLALCARQNDSERLREAAYNAIKTVCKAPKDLFLFVKFAHDLSQPNSGWGHGWRRVIIDWYLKKEPMELAECVTRFRGRYGWTHRDIIKLSHPKSDDVAISAILRYIIRGLKEMKKEFGEKQEAQQVISYLQTIEDFKHCEDEHNAARLIESHSLSLDHVPAHFLKSKEVWNALVPHLPLGVVLQNLKRLGRLRFLRGNQPLVSKVLDALNNQTSIAESNLHPAHVLVTLRNYENLAKPTYIQPSTEPETKAKTPPQPHPKIVEALNQLLMSTFTLLVPTGMRYLVAIDVRSQMVHGKCWHCINVSPAQAATLITLCLVKAERDVTVVAFGTEGSMQPVELDKRVSMQEAQDKLKEIPNGPVDLTQPLLWAKKVKKPVDVFIILTDTQVKQGKLKAVKALQQYRTALNLPNAKMVTCGLSVAKFVVACPSEPGMLDIAGFDAQVPRVIEAFSRGAF